ncbi:hypothetical protein DM806_04945 [Sphingobium lactosutens]|uniref:hypothetical protein n=1 Tax=Sphingobium lactosutens TaxID=522773 RepID=UPI0015B86419|nr:hypothetical protein [Sphingobium lactosutens]NWK95026.1 hypothetical protein [Sphingobium lactosutens]
MRTSNERLPLDRNQCQDITTGLNEGYVKLDDMIAHTLRLGTMIVETGKASGLDPLSSQKLYASLADCAANMVRSRGDLVSVHQQAHKIRMRSTSADVHLWGCTIPAVASSTIADLDKPATIAA